MAQGRRVALAITGLFATREEYQRFEREHGLRWHQHCLSATECLPAGTPAGEQHVSHSIYIVTNPTAWRQKRNDLLAGVLVWDETEPLTLPGEAPIPGPQPAPIPITPGAPPVEGGGQGPGQDPAEGSGGNGGFQLPEIDQQTWLMIGGAVLALILLTGRRR